MFRKRIRKKQVPMAEAPDSVLAMVDQLEAEIAKDEEEAKRAKDMKDIKDKAEKEAQASKTAKDMKEVKENASRAKKPAARRNFSSQAGKPGRPRCRRRSRPPQLQSLRWARRRPGFCSPRPCLTIFCSWMTAPSSSPARRTPTGTCPTRQRRKKNQRPCRRLMGAVEILLLLKTIERRNLTPRRRSLKKQLRRKM